MSIQFITQLNNKDICAGRAECTGTGQNIDTALYGITSNTIRVTGGTGISITENPFTIGSTVPTGQTGPQGFCGPKGFCGPSGSVGGRGDTGMKGFCGPSGVRGSIGDTGLRGSCGPSGMLWNPMAVGAQDFDAYNSALSIGSRYQTIKTVPAINYGCAIVVFVSYADSSYTSAFSVQYKWASTDSTDVTEFVLQYRYNVYEHTFPLLQQKGKAYTLSVMGVAGDDYGALCVRYNRCIMQCTDR